MAGILVFFLLSTAPQVSSATPHLAVGQATLKRSTLAFVPIIANSDVAKEQGRLVLKKVRSDLEFIERFQFLHDRAYTGDPSNFSGWKSAGADLTLGLKIEMEQRSLKIEARLSNVAHAKEILGKRYTAQISEWEKLAHTIADDVVRSLTGRPSIFLSRVAMVCETGGSGKNVIRDLFVSDFDGSNMRQITKLKTIVMTPDWSPKADKIVYSAHVRGANNIKNQNLYEHDFRTNRVQLISNRKGVNLGAIYHPDGKSLFLSMSFLGNPDIFQLTFEKNEVRQITRSIGFDVDPALSPDARELAFVGTRKGQPMVFVTDVAGKTKDPRQVTVAGKYNASPSWSVDNKIVYASWISGIFDLFVITADGNKLDRLTQDQGSNENPHFSSDGEYIVFDSSRSARNPGDRHVFVMDLKNTFAKPISLGHKNCSSPKFSPVK